MFLFVELVSEQFGGSKRLLSEQFPLLICVTEVPLQPLFKSDKEFYSRKKKKKEKKEKKKMKKKKKKEDKKKKKKKKKKMMKKIKKMNK